MTYACLFHREPGHRHSNMWTSFGRLSILVLHLALLFPVATAFHFPWLDEPTRIRLWSSRHLEVPADRAILSVHVQSKGPSQDVVREEIRSSQNELLALLRPFERTDRPERVSRALDNDYSTPSRALHTEQSTPSRARSDTGHSALFVNSDKAIKDDDDDFHSLNPNLRITVKSLDTSNFRTKATLLGERPIHEARMEYEVEVLNMSILPDVVFNISALSRASIHSLKWKLSDAAAESATGQCMEGAARLLKLKADNVRDTLGLRDLRVVDVREQSQDWRSPRYRWEADDGVDQVALMSQHDELEVDYPVARGRNLQPKKLEFEVKLDGEFLAT